MSIRTSPGPAPITLICGALILISLGQVLKAACFLHGFEDSLNKSCKGTLEVFPPSLSSA